MRAVDVELEAARLVEDQRVGVADARRRSPCGRSWSDRTDRRSRRRSSEPARASRSAGSRRRGAAARSPARSPLGEYEAVTDSAIELQRIGEVEPVARPPPCPCSPARSDRTIRAAGRRRARYARGCLRHRRTASPPATRPSTLDDRMLLGEPLAEERDRAHVLERPRVDARRHESLAGIAEHDQRVAAERNRPEESGLGVGHRLELLRLRGRSGRCSRRRCSTSCRTGSGRPARRRSRSAPSCRSRTARPASCRRPSAASVEARARPACR